MEEKKSILINAIENVVLEEVIDFLLPFVTDFININDSHTETLELDELGNLKSTISSGPGEGEINSSSKSVEDIVIFKENEGK